MKYFSSLFFAAVTLCSIFSFPNQTEAQLVCETDVFEIVGSDDFTGGSSAYMSLEIHPTTGEPWVAYRDDTNGQSLSVMRFDGSSWVYVGAPAISPGIVAYTDLKFDPITNHAFVAFRDFSQSGRIAVYRFDGSSWSSLGTSVSSGNADQCWIAIDPSSGYPWVVYQSIANGTGIRAKRWDGSSWVLIGGGNLSAGIGANPAIEFNPFDNSAVVAYQDNTAAAKITVRQSSNGTTWSTLGSGFSSTAIRRPDITFNPSNGEIHIAYTKWSSGRGEVASYNGTWSLSPQILDGFADYFRIEYVSSTDQLFVINDATGLNTVKTLDNGAWIQVGSTLPSNAYYVDIALDANGLPFVSSAGGNSALVAKLECGVLGCMDETACNYDAAANVDDGSCQLPDGCTDVTACNYDPSAQCDDNTCEFTSCLGCTNPVACNYDDTATQDDGSCLDDLGCTDMGACNYNETANCDDGSCEFTSCLGCTDPLACEYNPASLIDDGSCQTYPGDVCDDFNIYTENDLIQPDCGCFGTPIDSDGDGITDEEEINVYGTNPDLQDSDYDGLTDGLELGLSGTDPLDPDSNGDGCGDAEAFAGLCPGQDDCMADFNNDGFVNGTDLLAFLGLFGTSCD